MKNLKKDLQGVTKDLNAITKKVDRMLEVVGKLEKPKVVKKTVVKKAATVAATDVVLGIIKKSGKGIDTAGLKKKTGFKERKIWDIIKTLKKQGKIKSEGRGLYLKA